MVCVVNRRLHCLINVYATSVLLSIVRYLNVVWDSLISCVFRNVKGICMCFSSPNFVDVEVFFSKFVAMFSLSLC